MWQHCCVLNLRCSGLNGLHPASSLVRRTSHEDWTNVWIDQVLTARNLQLANKHVNDLEQSVAASYFLLLARLLFFTISLKLQIHLKTCSIDLNAKTVKIADESSSSTQTSHLTSRRPCEGNGGQKVCLLAMLTTTECDDYKQKGDRNRMVWFAMVQKSRF